VAVVTHKAERGAHVMVFKHRLVVVQQRHLRTTTQPNKSIAGALLGPFHGAIAVPSVTRCRCRCRRCRRGHRCAAGVRHLVNGLTAARSGEWAQLKCFLFYFSIKHHKNVNAFFQATWATLISASVATHQLILRDQDMGLVYHVVCRSMPQLLPVLIYTACWHMRVNNLPKVVTRDY